MNVNAFYWPGNCSRPRPLACFPARRRENWYARAAGIRGGSFVLGALVMRVLFVGALFGIVLWGGWETRVSIAAGGVWGRGKIMGSGLQVVREI